MKPGTWIAVGAIAFLGCRTPTRSEDPPAPSRVVANPVASVGGVGIAAAEVAERAARLGVSPREALDELEAELLLEEEARRRGLSARVGEHERRQVLVQLLLRSVEERIGEDALREEAVARAMPAARNAARAGESMTYRQIVFELVDVSNAAARRRARELAAAWLEDWRRAPPTDAQLAALATSEQARLPGIRVVYEPRVVRDAADAHATDFRERLFAAPVGVVPEALTSRRGIHLVEVLSRREATLDDASVEREARRIALDQARAAEVRSLVARLARETPVRIEEAIVTRVFARDGLFDEPAEGTP